MAADFEPVKVKTVCKHFDENTGSLCSIENCPILHLQAKPLSHQVAGHKFGGNKVGILQCPDGFILKPVQSAERGIREWRFYEDIAHNDDKVSDALRKFMPAYFGKVDSPVATFLKLEDIAHDLKFPCITDIKVGPRTWDPLANDAKIARERKKFPPLPLVGYQMLGCRFYLNGSSVQHFWDKGTCRKFSCEDIILRGWYSFFGASELRRSVLMEYLRQLLSLRDFFYHQKTYLFYAASLLFVYDAAPFIHFNGTIESELDDVGCAAHDSLMTMPPASAKVQMKLIDFAHVFPANGAVDSNFLVGISCLLMHLEFILHHISNPEIGKCLSCPSS